MADSLVAVITLVSNRPGSQGADGVPFDTEERIGAREFLKTIGSGAAHLLALERSKRGLRARAPALRCKKQVQLEW